MEQIFSFFFLLPKQTTTEEDKRKQTPPRRVSYVKIESSVIDRHGQVYTSMGGVEREVSLVFHNLTYKLQIEIVRCTPQKKRGTKVLVLLSSRQSFCLEHVDQNCSCFFFRRISLWLVFSLVHFLLSLFIFRMFIHLVCLLIDLSGSVGSLEFHFIFNTTRLSCPSSLVDSQSNLVE